MKATPENATKALIKAFLNAHSFYWYPAVAGMYSVGGIPDFVGHYKGHFIGIEAKRPGGKATPLQLREGKKIQDAGGAWFLISGPEGLKEVEAWMQSK